MLNASLANADERKTVRPYPALRIAPHVWAIHGPLGSPTVENQGFMNNPAWVETANSVVVIDPGSSLYAGRMVVDQIRQHTRKPISHVFNTHVHGDHWLGNQAMLEENPNAHILAHPLMIAEAKATAADEWLAQMSKVTDGYTDGTQAVIPAQAVDNDITLTIGGLTFHILAPPKAHSGTDIMIHLREEGVLFAGDNVLSGRIARMDDATFRGNINACNVALASGARIILPGHGPTGGVETIITFRTLLTTLYETTRRYYSEGIEAYEAKPRVKQALAPFQGWVEFERNIGKQIELAYLEAEQADFE
ncbi:putative beta-lactamase domain-containing protein [Magnetofaba australis IT-1]|uniref:Putative beta-lactamase domain-containing protein n=2 Tax=Magnetofaba TaxID=1472292 RepID=A0A1Y2JYT9_9PROT|nr:putative beta-lactamase domain-containing protein [Magnetofaba australis IT-1]